MLQLLASEHSRVLKVKCSESCNLTPAIVSTQQFGGVQRRNWTSVAIKTELA